MLRNHGVVQPRVTHVRSYLTMVESLEVHREEEQPFGRDWYDPDCFATANLDAKYEEVNVDDVVEQLTHLSKSQQDDLLNVLEDFNNPFDGTLGVYPHRKLHINIKATAKMA